jgi:hypothetical protein
MAMSDGQRTSVQAAGRGAIGRGTVGGGAGGDLWPVRIGAAGGSAEWRFTSVRRVGQLRSVVAELALRRTGQALTHDLADGRIIEERVGFPLPEQVHDVLRRIPGEPYFSAKAQTISMAKIWETPGLRPETASDVSILGRDPVPYGDMFGGELRVWTDRDVRVEILGSRSTTLRAGGGSRLAYRILQEGAVIFAGDDVMIPAGMNPASVDALRTVVAGGEWDPETFTQRQEHFMATRGSDLNDALAELALGDARQDLSAPAAPEIDAPPFEDFAIDL